jgi:hypothetical protein
MKRYCLVKDDDGHTYLVPVEEKELFDELLDSGEDGEDDFITHFDPMRLGCHPSCLTFTDPKQNDCKPAVDIKFKIM